MEVTRGPSQSATSAQEAGVTAVEAWFADGGIVAAHLARARDLTRGILLREAAVLEALVESACRGDG